MPIVFCILLFFSCSFHAGPVQLIFHPFGLSFEWYKKRCLKDGRLVPDLPIIGADCPDAMSPQALTSMSSCLRTLHTSSSLLYRLLMRCYLSLYRSYHVFRSLQTACFGQAGDIIATQQAVLTSGSSSDNSFICVGTSKGGGSCLTFLASSGSGTLSLASIELESPFCSGDMLFTSIAPPAYDPQGEQPFEAFALIAAKLNKSHLPMPPVFMVGSLADSLVPLEHQIKLCQAALRAGFVVYFVVSRSGTHEKLYASPQLRHLCAQYRQLHALPYTKNFLVPEWEESLSISCGLCRPSLEALEQAIFLLSQTHKPRSRLMQGCLFCFGISTTTTRCPDHIQKLLEDCLFFID